MKLKDAILLARKNKCKLKCDSLKMYEQSAKNLIHWLFVEKCLSVYDINKTTDWELDLDYTDKKFHLRVVENSSPRTVSFHTKYMRSRFLNQFKKQHGSLDDCDGYYIDLVFDGVIKRDMLSTGGK